ncbi:hypothetical protein KEM55_003766 [Ascosphaera atra]|nr:hypothetical protein KEM55_003766 [Ascosphaera atra]
MVTYVPNNDDGRVDDPSSANGLNWGGSQGRKERNGYLDDGTGLEDDKENDDDEEMVGTEPPSVPELFYNACPWTHQDMSLWDNASWIERLEMICRLDVDYRVIPVRVLIKDRLKNTLSFSPESRRMSGAILVYDHRPFLDWYCNFARRRAGFSPNVTIPLTGRSKEHTPSDIRERSSECTCAISSASNVNLQGLDIICPDNTSPRTPTTPTVTKVDYSDNSAWLKSICLEGNTAVMRQLSYMWDNPVEYGIVQLFEVLEKIGQVRHAWNMERGSELNCRYEQSQSPVYAPEPEESGEFDEAMESADNDAVVNCHRGKATELYDERESGIFDVEVGDEHDVRGM